MNESEKRKLFRKRWLQAFFSPLRSVKHGTRLENGVYDADDRRMRNIYFIFKVFNLVYLIVLSFFSGILIPEGVGILDIDQPLGVSHPLVFFTLFVPLYFILVWVKSTFFLAAFDVENNEKTAKGEAKDNLDRIGFIQVALLLWTLLAGSSWFVILS